jgi:hypothetical protein
VRDARATAAQCARGAAPLFAMPLLPRRRLNIADYYHSSLPSDFPLMSWRRRHATVIFHAMLRYAAMPAAAAADAFAFQAPPSPTPLCHFRCRLRCHAATPLFFADAIIAAFMTAPPLIFAITLMMRHASRQPPLRHFAASAAYFTPPRHADFTRLIS